MDGFRSELVQPYRFAQHQFLQPLITDFRLRRHASGTRLTIRFDEQTPTIWSRFVKSQIHGRIPDFAERATDYQRQLDAVLVDGTQSEYHHAHADFPLRYGSGGTLPIVHRKQRDYFCLFYRDIHPIGWNIANGGCDSHDELLNPLISAERELREELIVFKPSSGPRWYIFASDAGKPLDHPDFAVARRLWLERFQIPNPPDPEDWQIPLKWSDGPDSLEVCFGDEPPVITRNCFLNVNALDFGIEVDRIARLSIDGEAVLLDGELIQGQVINRPVGLFPVQSVAEELRRGTRHFVPEIVFYDGEEWPGEQTEAVVERFLESVGRLRDMDPGDCVNMWRQAAFRFDLCPVTARLIRRVPAAKAPRQPWDVFISFASEDEPFAERVADHLSSRIDRKIFFSKHSIRESEFWPVIDGALDSARCLIVVCSDYRHTTKRYVSYEWRFFYQERLLEARLNGEPPGLDGELVSFRPAGLDPSNLPRPLRHLQSYPCGSVREPQLDMNPLIETVERAFR
ncbi:MAG: TIR domain-containing protein [Candidatus Eisenbacteria bacterium]|nr:TIR domain-containing protein [Candidatus Eisenbacteria bacterium]